MNFAIVAAGENAASPHHEPGPRVIAPGEVVLCDFGGTMLAEGGAGYCSDITRCVVTGEPTAEMAEVYAVLHEAQAAAVAAGHVGTPAETVDAAARDIITDAGYGEWFVHRTGHGIGVEEHEDPYIVTGNRSPLVVGNAYSVEPGIYLPGRFGFRLEDIVVTADARPRRPQPRRPPPRLRRRLSPEPPPPDDLPRRRLRPAPVGHRRPVLPLDHHPPP